MADNLDAFGRLRVANPTGLFDSQFTYGDQSLLWETVTTSGGSIASTTADGLVTMTVDTTSGASVIRQTRQYIRYQPGRSQLGFLTFVLGSPVTGITKTVGYGDGSNGLFLQQLGDGTLQFVIRRAGVDTAIIQTEWNTDTFAGLGPSKGVIDPRNSQIFWFDFEALYVGTIRFGFLKDGVAYTAHQQNYANLISNTYIVNANLPLRYQITASGVTAGGSMKHICGAVFSEGGFDDDRAYTFAASNGTTGISVTTRRAIISIRPKATFNSVVNRGQIIASAVELATVSAAARVQLIELVYNPTYTTGGGALTWTSADANSIVEYSVHGDANAGAFTAGLVMAAFYLSSATGTQGSLSTPVRSRLPLTLDSTGANPIALALVITATGATTCYGALNWREIY